jgi:hypothetical protein
VLRDVLKLSDTLKSNVAPALVVGASVDLYLIIVGGVLKSPLFLSIAILQMISQISKVRVDI